MKNVIKIFCYFILSFLLTYNLIIISKSIMRPWETPDFFGVKTYVVASGSMSPELEIGDIVVVKKVDEIDLQMGDIISFREGEKIVTHRILSIVLEDSGFAYRTKGDNNNTYDSKVTYYHDIEGKLLTKIPKVGNILIFLQNGNVIIILIVLYYMFIFFKGIKKK